jgi:hypothetical protein
MSSRDIANLKNGLVAAWIPSLGSTGYRLVDRVGSNHGVLTNMDAASDWVVSGGAGALDFDGVDDRVLVPNSPAFNIPKNLTVSFWVNTNSSGSNVELIQKMGAGEVRLNSSWEAYLNNAGTVWFRLNGTENNLISTSNLPLSKWVNVVCIKDGATIAMYFDAVAVGTLGGQPDINISTGSLTLGAYPDGSFPINARFDDIRIYNRAISATEVSLLSKERGIGFKRSSSAFAKRYSYKPPKDKTYAAITRSQSDYDSLREGLVLAICPSVSGATGYRAVDVSGRGNHGSLVNMDAASDWVASGGMALDFDGVNDYASFGFGGIGKLTNSQATVSVWVNSATVSVRQAIIADWNSGGIAESFALQISSLGKIGIFVRSQTAVIQETSIDSISTNTWTNLIVTAGNNGLYVYKNGVQVYANATSIPLTNGTTTSIGRGGAFDGLYYQGQLDDIRIYNRPLTVPEIRRLASGRGVGLKPTSTHTDYIETREKTYSVIVKSQQEHSSLSEGLVGAWCPSLGASGYRLVDRSGYGNHGTLTNMDAATDWVVSGGALSLDFDGSNDRIEAKALRYLALPLTIACWVKPNTVSGVQMLASHYGAEGNRAWYLALINNAVRILVSPDGSAIPYGQGGTVTTDWTHVVGVIGASAFQIYLNGNAVSTTLTGSYPTSIFNSTANVIFADRATTDTPLNGQLDDIRIYNRALTPPEIRLLASKRGIGLRSQKQTMFYQFPSGSKRRRILTGMP